MTSPSIDEILKLVSRRQPLSLLEQDIYLEWLRNQDNAAGKIAKLEEEARRIDGVVGGIVPKGQARVTKISQITNDLGDMIAGRFIAPASNATSTEPTDSGFTGTAMSGDGETFGSSTYHIVGVNAGTLQFGLSAEDGKAYFGGGEAQLDADGLALLQGNVSIGTDDPSKVQWFDTSDLERSYIQDATFGTGTMLRLNKIVLPDEVYSQYLSLYMDNNEYVDVGGGDAEMYFIGAPLGNYLFIRFTDTGGSYSYMQMAHSTTEKFTKFNPENYDQDMIFLGTTDDNLVYIDAGADLVGIGVQPTAAKLEVAGDILASNHYSSTYTPTLTNVANLDSTAAFLLNYFRVGDLIHVSGLLNADPTTANVLTQVRISLPVASNFSASYECTGVGQTRNAQNESSGIYADTTNDEALLSWLPVGATNRTVDFSFTYRVL